MDTPHTALPPLDALRKVLHTLTAFMDFDAVEQHLRHSPEDYTHVLRVALAAIRRPEQARENVLEGWAEEAVHPTGDAKDEGVSYAFPTPPFSSTTAFPTLSPSSSSSFFLAHARPLPLLLPLQWETQVAPLLDGLIRVAHSLPLHEAILAWSLVHTSMQEDLLRRYGTATASKTEKHHSETEPSQGHPPTSTAMRHTAASSASSTRSPACRPLSSERALYWKLQELQYVLRSRFYLVPSSSSLYKKGKPSSHLFTSLAQSSQLSPSVSKKLSGAEWALLQWLSSQEIHDLS